MLGKGKSLITAVNTLSSIVTGGPQIGETDTDGDGLRDWEEAVRGTDPNKSDTDGDATSDGDEAKLNRDPLKPGPDDSLFDEESQKFLAELIAAASSTNLTDDVSQTIFARYVAARGEGTSGDIQAQAALVTEAMTTAEVPYRGIVYQASDFNVVEDTSVNIRAFANGSMDAIARHPDANFSLAMHAFGRAMEGDAVALRELRSIGTSYALAAQQMASVPVPRSYLNDYLLAVNALSVAGGAFEDMAAVSDDPIRAVAGLQNYDRMISGGAGAFVLLARRIDNAGLLFSANEPGQDWSVFISLSTARS